MLKQLLFTWLNQTKIFKDQNQIVEIKFNQKQNQFKRDLFTRWLLGVREAKTEKTNELIAQTFYIRHLMIKIVREWSAYCEYKSLKRLELTQATQDVNKIKLKLLFLKWKQKTRELMSEQAKHELADRVYKRNLIKKMLKEWRLKYVPQSRLIKSKHKQAERFLEIRLKTEFYFKWLLKYELEEKQRDKNRKALLFWSLNVQKTHMQAWFRWSQEKKLKKERYKQALNMRNKDILRECARKFIIYSTDSKQRRLNANKMYKEKQSIHQFDLENKYFNLWLSKCEFYKHKKPASLTQKEIFVEIKESPSLEKMQEMSRTISVVDTLSPVSRPPPRKPVFLLQSLDTNQPLKAEIKNENEEAEREENFTKFEIKPKSSVILLPPSAFVLKQDTPVKQVTFMLPLDAESPNEKKKDTNDLELIEFKKRLETFSIKSERLK